MGYYNNYGYGCYRSHQELRRLRRENSRLQKNLLKTGKELYEERDKNNSRAMSSFFKLVVAAGSACYFAGKYKKCKDINEFQEKLGDFYKSIQGKSLSENQKKILEEIKLRSKIAKSFMKDQMAFDRLIFGKDSIVMKKVNEVDSLMEDFFLDLKRENV